MSWPDSLFLLLLPLVCSSPNHFTLRFHKSHCHLEIRCLFDQCLFTLQLKHIDRKQLGCVCVCVCVREREREASSLAPLFLLQSFSLQWASYSVNWTLDRL